MLASFSTTPIVAETLDLDPASWKEVTFKDIKPTKYSFENSVLLATVEGSSSALLKPFDKQMSVKGVSFEWRLEGQVKTTAANERTKAGDDFPLRLGMIISGKAPWVPFFAPAWIKAVQNIMKLPTNLMTYLVAGAAAAPGAKWDSPYSDSIKNLALASKPIADGWQRVDEDIGVLEVVGLWLMADGDNTSSQFKVSIRKAELR